MPLYTDRHLLMSTDLLLQLCGFPLPNHDTTTRVTGYEVPFQIKAISNKPQERNLLSVRREGHFASIARRTMTNEPLLAM